MARPEGSFRRLPSQVKQTRMKNPPRGDALANLCLFRRETEAANESLWPLLEIETRLRAEARRNSPSG